MAWSAQLAGAILELPADTPQILIRTIENTTTGKFVPNFPRIVQPNSAIVPRPYFRTISESYPSTRALLECQIYIYYLTWHFY